jgi:hypothetical protein
MYVYYEHHRDAANKIILTELRLSSYGDGSLALKKNNSLEDMMKDLCLSVLKWPPIGYRSYDPPSVVWAYFGQYGVSSTYGEEILNKLYVVCKPVGQIDFIEVKDLAAQAVNHYVNLSKPQKDKIKADEFFYNKGTPFASATLTRDTIQQKLCALLGVGDAAAIDKRSYRAAAMKFHPDLNNGDGSKMSELNMLWRLYNA